MIENLIDIIFNEVNKLIDSEKEKLVVHYDKYKYNLLFYKKKDFLENPFINIESDFNSINILIVLFIKNLKIKQFYLKRWNPIL